jgi:DNA (cytosine-5)-methyltransferase 1
VTVTAVDLFCGCGGLSAGLIDAGFVVEEAYDCWPRALDTYERNIDAHAVPLDLMDVASAAGRIASIDPVLLAGAPPCQDFSTAGKRVEAEQANLTTAFGQIVSLCQPPAFLMENVPQVRLSATYQRMRRTVADAGYSLVEAVLDASWFGVPQQRRRFFAFGYLGNGEGGTRFEQSLDRARSAHRLTVKQYMGDEIDVEYYYRHPRNYSRRSVFSVHEPSPTVRGVNRPVPPNYAGNRLDSAPPSQVRPLTTRERGRVQTFPREWMWDGGDRNADSELLIGNAVPVQLAARVGTAIRDAIDW